MIWVTFSMVMGSFASFINRARPPSGRSERTSAQRELLPIRDEVSAETLSVVKTSDSIATNLMPQ
jgi:hypothetical protein